MKMHVGIMAGLAALTLSCVPALAEEQLVYASGSPGSQNHRTATTLAAEVSKADELNVQVQSYAGLDAWLPLINIGEIDVGNLVLEQGMDALTGKGNYKGRRLEDVRLVAALFPTNLGMFVQADSPIQKIADVAGKSLTYGYTAQPGITKNIDAVLLTAGLTSDDVEHVLVPSVGKGGEAFKSGAAEVGFFAYGAGKLVEIASAVGGIRFLPLPEANGTEAKLQETLASAYITIVEPKEDVPGVAEPTPMLTADYVLVAGAHVSEKTVYNLIKVIVENLSSIAAVNKKFIGIDATFMARDLGINRHPGAQKYFEEIGVIN